MPALRIGSSESSHGRSPNPGRHGKCPRQCLAVPDLKTDYPSKTIHESTRNKNIPYSCDFFVDHSYLSRKSTNAKSGYYPMFRCIVFKVSGMNAVMWCV